jgi:hypothetical protein
MFSKWRIKGLDGYVFCEEGKLYKLPFTQGGRGYELREIKKQDKNRYKINGVWWSQRQIKPNLYLDPEPVKLLD